MAIDHALFEAVQSGAAPVLRLYRWDPPCLSLGRNQPARYDAMQVMSAGATLVRRPTGGLAVYHDRELTYALSAPVGVIGRPRVAFARISRFIADALRALDVPAEIASQRASAQPMGSPEPCFRAAAPGEVIAHGEKLVGSAQRCERQTILQHGSLLLDGDQAVLDEWLEPGDTVGATAIRQVNRTANTSVRALTGAIPAWSALCDAVVRAFRKSFGDVEPATLSSDEMHRIKALEDHYRSAAWTWRR
jgi:lipoate-protein ligase A